MGGRTSGWRRWLQGALLAVFALDAGLAIARWRISVAASRQQLQLTALRLRAEVGALRSNMNRVEAVRRRMPQIAADCDRFYGNELLGPSQGYAALVADLGDVAQKAGLITSGVRFAQKNASEHGVTEVDITAVIEGSYGSLIRFINGLEQSRNFYVLDSLQLASSTGGQVKLNLRLHTYFRA